MTTPTAALATAVTWLFVPATQPARFAKAVDSGADAVVIDLEDAVAAEDKEQARAALRAHWPREAAVPVVVRVNGTASKELADDLAACRTLSPAAVVLPKAETADEVRAVADHTGVGVLALVESARGLVNLPELAASPHVLRLQFGSVDLGLELGTSDDAALDSSRADLVRWSAACGLPQPVDGVCTAIGDSERLTREAVKAKGWGFGGKLCIHPNQVPVVHDAFAPSAEELGWARRVLDVEHDGAQAVDGQLIDRPVVERARRIIRLAERFRAVSG